MNKSYSDTPKDYAENWVRYALPLSWFGTEYQKCQLVDTELYWASKHPEKLWEAILLIVAQNLSEEALAMLGAGCLETLANKNPEFVFERLPDALSRFPNLVGPLSIVNVDDHLYPKLEKLLEQHLATR